MYYIHDLYTDTWRTFASREAVAFWWGNKRNFHDLNVTGKDYYASKDYRGYVLTKDGTVRPLFSETAPCLRRYQVFDGAFRSIDIRLWPDSVWNAPRPRLHPYCYRSRGSKYLRRKPAGPSMARSTQRQNTDRANNEELHELGCPLPERDRSAIRHKILISDTDYEDYIDKNWDDYRSDSCSKSWKDQYKSRKQWGKHRHIPRIPQEVPENGEDLAARLTKELVLESSAQGTSGSSGTEI